MLNDLGEIVLYETANGDAIRLVENWRGVKPADLPEARYKRRASYTKDPLIRDLSKVTTVIIHQTAVEGGFGIRKKWLATVPGNPSDEDRALIARMRRYAGAPYHGIYSPRDRASIVQWSAEVYTYHGHGSNRWSVGWAIDGKYPGDDLDVDAARAALTHTIEVCLDQGCALTHVGAHRQHAAARGGDPGAEIWRGVVLPIAEDFGLEVSDRVTGSGRPVPGSWGSS